MNKILVLGVPVSPSTKITLESLGKRQNVFCNFGGSVMEVYGKIIESNDKYMVVEATETNRKINIYHNYISFTEEIELWKQTNHHANENFKETPLINYFITRGGATLKQKEEHNSDIPKSPLLEKIAYSGC